VERHYETVCMIRPDMGEEGVSAIIKKGSSLVEKHSGKDINVQNWGRRRLAYRIQRKIESHYVLFNYTSPPDASKELERMLRYNEDVMRYQTVVVTKRPKAKESAVSTEPLTTTPPTAEPLTTKPSGGENV